MNPEFKKETYEEAKTEIIVFECEDIIQTSGGTSSGGSGSGSGSGGNIEDDNNGAVVLPGDSFWP